MKKTFVLIVGTNCTGKSTVVRKLITRFGGASKMENNITYLNDRRVAVIGYYGNATYSGIDRLNKTSSLPDIIRQAFLTSDVVVGEGLIVGTFGINPLNAFFTAEKQLCLYLYADKKTLSHRLFQRADYQNIGGGKQVMIRQQRILNAVKKYSAIGIPVLSIDTSTYSADIIVDLIFQKLKLQ